MGTFLGVMTVVGGLLIVGSILWAIMDITGREDLDGSAKALWVLVALFFPIIGVVVYLVGMAPKQSAPKSSPRPRSTRPPGQRP